MTNEINNAIILEENTLTTQLDQIKKSNKDEYKCYDKTNSQYPPWIMNVKKEKSIIGPDNLPLTAEYVWSKNIKEREELVNFVFDYFRTNGFPYTNLTDEELKLKAAFFE